MIFSDADHAADKTSLHHGRPTNKKHFSKLIRQVARAAGPLAHGSPHANRFGKDLAHAALSQRPSTARPACQHTYSSHRCGINPDTRAVSQPGCVQDSPRGRVDKLHFARVSITAAAASCHDPIHSLDQPPVRPHDRPLRRDPSNAHSYRLSNRNGQGQYPSAPVATSAPAAVYVLCATESEHGRAQLWRKHTRRVRWLHSASSCRTGACVACVCCAKHLLPADCERSVPTHSLPQQQCLLQPLSSLRLCGDSAALCSGSLITRL